MVDCADPVVQSPALDAQRGRVRADDDFLRRGTRSISARTSSAPPRRTVLNPHSRSAASRPTARSRDRRGQTPPTRADAASSRANACEPSSASASSIASSGPARKWKRKRVADRPALPLGAQNLDRPTLPFVLRQRMLLLERRQAPNDGRTFLGLSLERLNGRRARPLRGARRRACRSSEALDQLLLLLRLR